MRTFRNITEPLRALPRTRGEERECARSGIYCFRYIRTSAYRVRRRADPVDVRSRGPISLFSLIVSLSLLSHTNTHTLYISLWARRVSRSEGYEQPRLGQLLVDCLGNKPTVSERVRESDAGQTSLISEVLEWRVRKVSLYLAIVTDATCPPKPVYGISVWNQYKETSTCTPRRNQYMHLPISPTRGAKHALN